MLKKIAVLCFNDEFQLQSQHLAEKLSIALLHIPDDTQFDFYLVFTSDGLTLHARFSKKMTPFYIDFLHGSMDYRCRKGGGRRQALARAVGLQPGYNPSVLDATAGLGRDSWILANLGCRVTMLERSPIVAALLENGLQRALAVKPVSIQLVTTEACDYLKSLSQQPDVIYVDPMFPHKPKVALVKKEMQLLQQLVTETDNAAEVFALALQTAKQRVVVKRPQWADAISDVKPNGVVMTKRYRFEIYSAQL